MEHNRAWVIFDADNTLWRIEHLYDQARVEMCARLAKIGVSPLDAEFFQRQRDKDLYRTYGYSADRFARSFEDTLRHFRPNALQGELRQVRDIALQVFEREAEPVEGIEQVIDQLKAHDYRLGIITAGERWVQEKRIALFHLRDRFDKITIVDKKSTEVFEAFCEANIVEKTRSWVVGDSIRSDIEPALRAGLKAVLVNADNWADVESTCENELGEYPVIHNLRDLVGVPGLLHQ